MIHEIVSKKGLMKHLQGKGFSLSVRIGTIATQRPFFLNRQFYSLPTANKACFCSRSLSAVTIILTPLPGAIVTPRRRGFSGF